MAHPSRSAIEPGIQRALHATLLLLCVVPLLFARPFVYPFIVVKVFAFQALVGVAAALWLTLAIRRRSWGRIGLTPIRTAVLVLLAVLAATSLAGVNPDRSLWSAQERALGLVALLHFAVLGFIVSDMRDELPAHRYLAASSLVSVLAAVFALVEIAAPATFMRPETEAVLRPGSFFRNPTFLAAYLLPHIFCMAYLARRAVRERRGLLARAWLAAGVLEVAVLFLTQTRGALLGLVAGSLVLLADFAVRGSRSPIWRSWSPRTASRTVLIVLGILGASLFFTRNAEVWQHVPGVRRLSRLTAASADIQPRLIALRAFWTGARERPLLGYGYENAGIAFDRHYDPRLLRYGLEQTYFDKPHNILLEYMVVAGAVGLLAWLGLLVTVGLVLLRSPALSEFAPFGIGLLVAHVANGAFFFETLGSSFGLFVILGFADGIARGAGAALERRPPVVTAGQRLAIGLAALACAAWCGVNAGALLANHRQYDMLTHFSHHEPAAGIESFESAMSVPANPYRAQVQRGFAAACAQFVSEGGKLPDAAATVGRARAAGLAAIQAAPLDYSQRVNFINCAAALLPSDRSFLAQGEEQAASALQLSPRRQETYFAWAKLESAAGGRERALELMQIAVALDPEVGECQFFLALLEFDAGRAQDGFTALEAAARTGRTPRTLAELKLVGGQFADAGDYRRALSLFNQALALAPGDLETQLKLGLAYYSVGDANAARQYIGGVAQATDLSATSAWATLKPILDELGIAARK